MLQLDARALGRRREAYLHAGGEFGVGFPIGVDVPVKDYFSGRLPGSDGCYQTLAAIAPALVPASALLRLDDDLVRCRHHGVLDWPPVGHSFGEVLEGSRWRNSNFDAGTDGLDLADADTSTSHFSVSWFASTSI